MLMPSHEEGLSSRDFTRLRELIYAETGICLSPEKKTMVEVRLKRRLADLEHGHLCRVLRFRLRPQRA